MSNAVKYFIESKSFLLTKGEDFDVLEGKELIDLKNLYDVGKIPTTPEISNSSSLTVFFEKAIYAFAGTKNGKGFEKFQKWIDASVLRFDGHLKNVLGKFKRDYTIRLN